MIEINNKKYRLIPEEHLDEILDAVKEIVKFHNSDFDGCDCEIPQEVWEGAELIQTRVVDSLCFDAVGIVLRLERLGFHQESSVKMEWRTKNIINGT